MGSSPVPVFSPLSLLLPRLGDSASRRLERVLRSTTAAGLEPLLNLNLLPARFSVDHRREDNAYHHDSHISTPFQKLGDCGGASRRLERVLRSTTAFRAPVCFFDMTDNVAPVAWVRTLAGVQSRYYACLSRPLFADAQSYACTDVGYRFFCGSVRPECTLRRLAVSVASNFRNRIRNLPSRRLPNMFTPVHKIGTRPLIPSFEVSYP